MNNNSFMSTPHSATHQQQKINTNRNLDHLLYDENLYDFMKSQIPFYIKNLYQPDINTYLLRGDRGLEKNSFLTLFYNDTIGKREFVNDLLLSAIVMK